MENHVPAGFRSVRLGETPTFTVVLTSRGDRGRLAICLRSLLPQCRELDTNTVVVREGSATEIEELSAEHPMVKFLAVGPGTPVSQMRTVGMSEADGDIVLLREDDPVPDGWLRELALWRRNVSE